MRSNIEKSGLDIRPKSSFGRKMTKGLKQYWDVFPYLIIGLIGFLVFSVYPIVKGIYMSFFQYNIINPAMSQFIGLANYIRAFHDYSVLIALRNTVLYSVVTVPGQWILGLILAVLINSKVTKFKVTFRMIYYVPVITSWIVISYLFKYLFASGSDGFINYLFYSQLHLFPYPINWLENEWSAMAVIWILGIWKGMGWVMIIYLAALQSISRDYYEAAMVDGAGDKAILRKITLPLLKPTTVFVFINLIMGSFNVFIQVYTITNGNPLGQTDVLLSYMYKQAFQFMDFGYSSALSVLMGVTVFILTYTQQKKIGKTNV
ncbi:MAG: sugar ABC transporter permease [Sporolactobacillus sp.]